VATVGGNLCNCSPCADTAPALLVYGARLELRGPAGKRVVPLGDFTRGPGQSCLQPGELLCGVLLDPPPFGAKTIYLKKGRVKVDLALASLAVLLVLEAGRVADIRLAAGSVAPTCLRLREAEDILRGKPLDENLLARAARAASGEISPIDDVRASADYRRRLIEVFLRRALDALVREGSA
jgi:carbon-monoxide dehydrogenase medium subunit